MATLANRDARTAYAQIVLSEAGLADAKDASPHNRAMAAFWSRAGTDGPLR